MRSTVSDGFHKMFVQLPHRVRTIAKKNYQLWKSNPNHPSLQFKRIHAIEPLYSVRVGIDWRAVGLMEGELITWIWIGSHADYDRLGRLACGHSHRPYFCGTQFVYQPCGHHHHPVHGIFCRNQLSLDWRRPCRDNTGRSTFHIFC